MSAVKQKQCTQHTFTFAFKLVQINLFCPCTSRTPTCTTCDQLSPVMQLELQWHRVCLLDIRQKPLIPPPPPPPLWGSDRDFWRGCPCGPARRKVSRKKKKKKKKYGPDKALVSMSHSNLSAVISTYCSTHLARMVPAKRQMKPQELTLQRARIQAEHQLSCLSILSLVALR